MRRILPALLVSSLIAWSAIPTAPPAPKPDERFKADILVVVAHPDDETMVTGYLAREIYEQHKCVAVIYGTRGNGGGNAVGNEQAAALGAEREIEARRALASLGIMNVWFLGGPDTPGQDVLRSLETWSHGAALDQAVRLIRLTRPEVILSWLPLYVSGENHADHQAAGVIATEAFDMAGDPTAFPEQVAAPRDANNIYNLTEGLQPWQPKKLYYFSDASHTEFENGKGPQYKVEGVAPGRNVPYDRLSAEEMSAHLTQGDTGQVAKEALDKGDFKWFREPEKLVLGKSLVGGTITGDIFEGVEPGRIAFAPPTPWKPVARTGVSTELGGPWAFYHDFWRVHDLKQLPGLLSGNEVLLGADEDLNVPILIHNDTGAPVSVTLTSTLPRGWKERRGMATYPVAPHETYPVYYVVRSPENAAAGTYDVAFKAASGDAEVGVIRFRVTIASGGLPQ